MPSLLESYRHRRLVDFQDMSSSLGEKVRFALGLFVLVRDLEHAVQELEGSGLPLRQVKVIAPPEESGSESSWSACGPALDVDTWIVSEASEGSCPWTFTPVHRARGPAEMPAAAAKREVMPDFHIWALERHAQQLDRHLRHGGGIAVVQVMTEDEERAAYATLLRYAKAGVQTHEVSRHS